MLWFACFVAFMAVILSGVVLRRRRPRDAALIVRRERAMGVLADINRDMQDQVAAPPTHLRVEERPSGNVTVLNADRFHPSRRRPPSRRRTRSRRPVRRPDVEVRDRPTVAHLPSVPGAGD